MDQMPSTDSDKVTDTCVLQYDSLVNSSEGDNLENVSNDDGIASGSNNEEKLPEKFSDSLHETESAICEKDVSSTYCAENEVIPNENDLVVEKHSTCEMVKGFENAEYSSEKVDADCSGEQPNTDDCSVHSNVNNMVEDLPSASDHIELPSASDHIDLPSASDHIKLSPVSDQIELPSPSHHVEFPSAPDHIDPPTSSDHSEQPSASDLIEQPSSSDLIEQPSSSDLIELPSASDHLELPEVFDHNKLSSPFDNAHVSSLLCAVTNTNGEGSPNIEAGTAGSPLAEVVTKAQANHTIEASLDTDDVTNTETNSNADVIKNEVRLNTEVVTNTEESSNAEVVTDSVARTNTEDVTHAEASTNTEIVAHTEVSPTAEISINTKVCTHVEYSLNTTVVANVEASPSTDLINDETGLSVKVVSTAEVNPSTESVTNPDSSCQPNETANDMPKIQNVCDGPGEEINPVNVETLDSRNNFLPTIVAIRGGCTDVIEKTNSMPEDASSSAPSEIPSLNIVSVLGGCKDINPHNVMSETTSGSSSPKKSDHTIDDSKENDVSNESRVHTGSEHNTSPITSEFLIKKDKTSNTEVEDPEVICIETTSKIPSPIPIKTESSIEGLNVDAESQSPIKPEKFTAKKRLTRSSLSQSNDCIILSSSSDVDSASDSKKRSRPSANAYSTAGYTCHLCNTVFQEHELLNEHMILHRNNSLIEAKVQNRSKTSKPRAYSCNVCQKQLSTSQSLQQHVLIHKNEKPFVCGVCQKDFRHLQNYRTHLQKHKAEQRRYGKTSPQGTKEQPDKSVVRGADFGRLVGPLFMKENLWHQEKDAGSSKPPSNAASFSTTTKKTAFPYAAKESAPHQPRLSFDQPPFKSNSHSSSSSPVIIRRREPSPDVWSDEECVAVKSFSNIESVVMNAAKIIVRLDNLDTSVLKRKLQTPDISIDLPPKKCRVMLSPIAEKCNIKLDEIENIPMDIDEGEIASPAAEQMDGDGHLYEGDEVTAGGSACPSQNTLTDHELFDLLNDDSVSADSADRSNNGKNEILEPARCKVDNSTNDSTRMVASPPPKRSNVIFVEATPPNYEICADEADEAVDSRLDDAFDTAFQKVAARRLALLRKRATENDGKVESRYLLGPLFWRKALRRAQKEAGDGTAVANVDITFSSCKNGSRGAPLRTRPSPFGGRSRFDNRRTNDPTKLQLRAERKFKYLLELAKMLSDLNSLNLAGPLFWRRTLQLAGVRRGEDLRMHVNVTSPTLDGIEFVDDGGQPRDFDRVLVNAEKTSPQPCDPVSSASDQDQTLSHPDQPSAPSSSDPVQLSPSHRVQPSLAQVPAVCTVSDDQRTSDQLGEPPVATNVVAGGASKLADKMPSAAHPELPGNDVAAENASNEVAPFKTDSILYESLTKPKEDKQQPSTEPEGEPPSYVDSSGVFVASEGTAADSSLASRLTAEAVEKSSNDDHQCAEPTGDVVDEGIAKLAAIDAGSIVLNVDSGGALQLIPAGDQMAGAGQNFVLVSDGSGAMQYMVNVPGDNFGNFELVGNGAGGDQVAYAIQFDGENYAAVQFVQEAGVQLAGDAGMKEAQMLADSKAATYLVADAGAPAAAAADPNHIGKELSDFLNLDYGNLLKNGTADQPIS